MRPEDMTPEQKEDLAIRMLRKLYQLYAEQKGIILRYTISTDDGGELTFSTEDYIDTSRIRERVPSPFLSQREKTKRIPPKDGQISKDERHTAPSKEPATPAASKRNFCKYCGARVDEDACFCQTCGKMLVAKGAQHG